MDGRFFGRMFLIVSLFAGVSSASAQTDTHPPEVKRRLRSCDHFLALLGGKMIETPYRRGEIVEFFKEYVFEHRSLPRRFYFEKNKIVFARLMGEAGYEFSERKPKIFDSRFDFYSAVRSQALKDPRFKAMSDDEKYQLLEAIDPSLVMAAKNTEAFPAFEDGVKERRREFMFKKAIKFFNENGRPPSAIEASDLVSLSRQTLFVGHVDRVFESYSEFVAILLSRLPERDRKRYLESINE
jgi:hypothetical protein